MSHSPEPWSVGEAHESEAHIVDATNKVLGIIKNGYGIVLPNDPNQTGGANVDRIVACVNFCRNFETEWLTGKVIVKASESVRAGQRPEDSFRSLADIKHLIGLVPVCEHKEA